MLLDPSCGMLQVSVSFPSGSGETLSLPEHAKVRDLKILAQKTLGHRFLRLVTAEGHALTNLEDSLHDAEVQEGDHLTAVAQEVNISASARAFALWCSGGDNILVWGDPHYGADCSGQDQLKNVLQIRATSFAFAAILGDGSVVTWGDPRYGGDSSALQEQLRNVQQIQATRSAFAAILADGSVLAWGIPDRGGDCSAVQDQLRNVDQIQAAPGGAFAAILVDKSVVTWGNAFYGGDSSAVQDQLRNVQQIQATFQAFAAILADGLVVAWGHPEKGGDCSGIEDQLQYL